MGNRILDNKSLDEKVLTNKYKIGQKVWVCFEDTTHYDCPLIIKRLMVEAIAHRHERLEYDLDGKDFGHFSAYGIGESDMFLTKAEAQARRDELNKEAQ